ncbi:MAG: hypothetical protein KDI37_02810 [Xanthomonadales bacterium]|nr:hypothetical protein [Xanthomonadales bacterium]
MMLLLPTIALLLCTAGWWQARRWRRAALLSAGLAPRGRTGTTGQWALVRDLDCPHSAALNCTPVSTEDTADLAALGCAPGRCHCHYAPLRSRV